MEGIRNYSAASFQNCYNSGPLEEKKVEITQLQSYTAPTGGGKTLFCGFSLVASKITQRSAFYLIKKKS